MLGEASFWGEVQNLRCWVQPSGYTYCLKMVGLGYASFTTQSVYKEQGLSQG